MKKVFSLLFVALFVVLCAVPSLGLAFTESSDAASNQVLAVKPALQKKDGSLNPSYLEDLSRYVNDRFSLRQEAITLWAQLNAALLRSSVTNQVVFGRDGWLYFSSTLPDYCRTSPMTGRELWCAARRLALLQEYAEAQGGQFLFTIAPNKNSLYPEHMPKLPRADGPTNAEALAESLSAAGVNYLDLFRVFRAQEETLYYPRDTHWNGRGAALAADAILHALGRESDFFSASFADSAHRGDLYEMLFPTGTDTDPDLSYTPGFSFTASTNNADSITIKTESAAAEGSLLMYRDSFGRALYPYLAEAFAEAQFSRKNDYDPTALAPGGVLIVELGERNLRYLLDYAPTMPAPVRDASLSEGARQLDGQIHFSLAKGGPEGYTVLRGDLSGFVPDDDSPIYIDTVLGLYEALPGTEGFSLCLPEEAAQGSVRVLFHADGALLSLACSPEV